MRFKKPAKEVKETGIKIKKSKKKLIIIVCIALLLTTTIVAVAISKNGGESKLGQLTATAEKGDITMSISGSGTVEPFERYDIVPLVKGSILTCDYEEGDSVLEDAILYEIDHEDMDISLTKAQNAVTKSQINSKTNYENIENTAIYSPVDGIITGLTIKAGDQVNSGAAIASVEDQSKLIATVSFNAAQANAIQIGDSAKINLEKYMTSLYGNVTAKSSNAQASSDGALLYAIEITVANPGAVSVDTKVTAVVNSNNGDMESPVAGTIKYPDAVAIRAEVSGKVKTVYVDNESAVTKGQAVLKIDDQDLKDDIKKSELEMSDQKLSYNSQKKQLDDYIIKSPITGTVITKNYKTGDTISTGTTSTTLMTVADMTKMKFTFETDELDISKVKIGQQVIVTADALPDAEFTGEVTKIANEGTVADGVTTYPVEVVISQPGALKLGMNVTAKIIYENKKDVICVPTSAVVYLRGTAFVFQKGADLSKASANQKSYKKEVATETQKPSNGSDMDNQTSNKKQTASGNKNSMNQNNDNLLELAKAQAPDGTVPVKVEIGLSDSTKVEIISGLNEGDEVVLKQNDNVNTTTAMKQTNMFDGSSQGNNRRNSQGGPPQGFGH